MTDNTAQHAHNLAKDTADKAQDFAEDTADKAQDVAEDAAGKAGDLADQARQAIDATVATATAAFRDIDTAAAVGSAQKFATDTFDRLAKAYKRNPAVVITVGSVAVAAVTGLGALLSKRR